MRDNQKYIAPCIIIMAQRLEEWSVIVSETEKKSVPIQFLGNVRGVREGVHLQTLALWQLGLSVLIAKKTAVRLSATKNAEESHELPQMNFIEIVSMRLLEGTRPVEPRELLVTGCAYGTLCRGQFQNWDPKRLCMTGLSKGPA